MLGSLKISASAAKRFCSSFVSRTRWVNRLRQDDAACAAALQSGCVFLFHRLAPLLLRTAQRTLSPPAFRTTELQSILENLGSDGSLLKDSVLIGCSEQNQAQFCLDVGDLDRAAVEAACEGTFIDLRRSFFLLSAADSPLVAKAQALLRWHQTNGFCSATGQPTVRNQAGSQRVCSSSGIIYYPKMSPVVIVLLSDGKRCLLARQPSFPPGLYSALAGFCDMGETLEESLRREVSEEVGLEVVSLSFSSSQHWPFPQSSLLLGCHASVSPAHTQVSVDHSELEDARWFSLEEINSALQVQTPPPRQAPPPGSPPTPGPAPWIPPPHAVAHRLIREWAELQRARQSCDTSTV